tara:strand:+ start:154 stop:579 length:426 start_codon:yes stop_codon:yes gene_type:complete
MALFSKTFVTANFVDSSKSVIQVIYKEGDEFVNHYVDNSWGHPEFEALLKLIDLEEIEKKWDEGVKSEVVTKTEDKSPLSTSEGIMDFIVENNKSIKHVFPFKVQALKIATTAEEKKNIQQSKTIFEVISVLAEHERLVNG